jgi:predicted transcriptional regulator
MERERETETQELTTELELKTPADVRRKLAELDVPLSEFARVAGFNNSYLAQILHRRVRYTRLARIRIEAGVRAVEKQVAPDGEQPAGRQHLPTTVPRIRRL